MRAQRGASDRERLVETAIKVGAKRDDVALGSNHFQRAEIGDKLTDFVWRRLTLDKGAMITGALMPLPVAATFGDVPSSVHRAFRHIVVAMRAARACFGGRCRFGAAVRFTRMCMMHTAAKCHMHD